MSDHSIDCREDARYVVQHLVVPEPHDSVALVSEYAFSSLVGCIIRMLTSVDFNDNSKLMTCEVTEVPADGRLPSKVMLLKRRLSQMPPDFLFSFRHLSAE